MKKILFAVYVCLIVSICNGQTVTGLDYTFNNSGYVEDKSGPVYIKHVVLTDGSIIQLGTIFPNASQRFGYVNKLNANGSINTDFNLPVSAYPNALSFRNNENSYLTSIITQTDGKIIVGGMSEYNETIDGTTYSFSDIALARLLPDGSLDQAFGINGKLVLPFGKAQNKLTDIALSTTGEIIIAGEYSDNTPMQTYVMRLTEDGSMDQSFGTNGLWTSSFMSNTFGTQIEMDIYDEVMVASNSGFDTVIVARILINGTLDGTYGTNGFSTINILEPIVGNRSQMRDMLIDSNEDVFLGVVMTGSNNLPPKASVFKLNYTGSLVSSFGSNGHFEFAEGYHYAMAFTPENKIISAVMRVDGLPFFYTTTKDGQIDSSPEYDYTLASEFFSGLNAYVRLEDITVLADGKIVATGYTGSKSSSLAQTGISIRLEKINPESATCAYQNKLVGFYRQLQDVCYDAQGNFFATDLNRHIIKFNAAGTVVKTWIRNTKNESENYPRIASDNAGNIFSIAGNSINKFSNDGMLLISWGTLGAGNGQLNYPGDIAIDSDQNVYVLDVNNNRIQKFDNNGNYLLQWNSRESNTQLMAICIDSDNNVYVSSAYSHALHKFNSSGTFIQSFDLGTKYCESIDYNPINNLLYVINYDLMTFSTSGVLQNTIETIASYDIPTHAIIKTVAVNKTNGSFAVTSIGDYNIHLFNSANTLEKILGGYNRLEGNFGNATAFTADLNGNVYVANDRREIQKFSAGNTYLLKWGGQGSADGKFNAVTDMAISKNNIIYIVDSTNNSIQCFDLNGNFIRKWGTKGTSSGQFNQPYRIVIDPQGFVYVFDKGNCRLQKFTSDGTFVSTLTICVANEMNPFEYAFYLMADSQSNIYFSVPNAGSVIRKINSSGFLVGSFSLLNASGDYQDLYNKICLAGDHFYQINTSNLLLSKFSLDGKFISACDFTAAYPDDVEFLTNMNIGINGKVYILAPNQGYILSLNNNIKPIVTSIHNTSLSEEEAAPCLVFPNPTTGTFKINITEPIDYVLIYDINGLSEKHTTAEIDTQLRGLLLIKIVLKNGTTQNSKVIKM
ncbi:6-bladed beta-propeller [Cytophaga hutchinsonii]|uniref:Secretion system C-terminal sorting domain-containing protein n=1 Tax=Cytophaga hutchinsonii (strain ATCC 33406 / DSM 1761 / CIP 103989 / NBRC 15051 / NCIMB 9469 / D465) TaxID=269798 RepID=A0A6N4SN80_CYTH3|nr:6-bladed beta-propeller [Cytophaga hutchinsonii]ABG57712.1 conserved hypothetical protein [Cytophaga hutchinsonii ATCC 33406]SFX03653.1 delta-60 repeat domain-containing protein [Cytophaga hutchinsonii ATCC 33406]